MRAENILVRIILVVLFSHNWKLCWQMEDESFLVCVSSILTSVDDGKVEQTF